MDNQTTIGSVLDWILENWKFILVIVGLFSTVIKIYGKINKFTTKIDKVSSTISTDLPAIKQSIDNHNTELSTIKDDVRELKQYQERDSRRNYYIIKGVLSSLRGLQEIGVSGPTDETTKEIEKYMMEQVTH